MPIGIFDSSLAGLAVLQKLQSKLPRQAFMYLYDAEGSPYEHKEPDEIFDISCGAVQCLFDRGCELVIIVCNNASAVALHKMQIEWLPDGKRRVLGVFVPVIEHLTQRDWGDNTPPTHTGLKNVAVFATQSTINSGAFQRELKFRARDVEVFDQICNGLVMAIENKDWKLSESLVEQYVGQLLLRLPSPQAAVLACTHFTIVEKMFQAALPGETQLINQPDLVVGATIDYLERHPRFVENGPPVYLTTGDVKNMRSRTKQYPGLEITWNKSELGNTNA